MADGDFVLGIDAKLYYNSASYASPTWVEIPQVKGVNLLLSKRDRDITIRTSAWELTRGALLAATLSFLMPHKINDAVMDVLRAAWISGDLVEFAVMSGAITATASEGLRAEMEIMEYTRDEQLTAGLMYSVVARPASVENAPSWINGSP